jgi:hypothetical protein
MAKAFVVADAVPLKGCVHVNYYQGVQMGFRSWTADPKRARHFDTRATAKRAAQECGKSARVELIDLDNPGA